MKDDVDDDIDMDELLEILRRTRGPPPKHTPPSSKPQASRSSWIPHAKFWSSSHTPSLPKHLITNDIVNVSHGEWERRGAISQIAAQGSIIIPAFVFFFLEQSR